MNKSSYQLRKEEIRNLKEMLSNAHAHDKQIKQLLRLLTFVKNECNDVSFEERERQIIGLVKNLSRQLGYSNEFKEAVERRK